MFWALNDWEKIILFRLIISVNRSERWEEDGDETTGEQPADLLEKLIEEADTKKVRGLLRTELMFNWMNK